MKKHQSAVSAVLVVGLTLLFFGASRATGQQATSFDQLQAVVKTGDLVSVAEVGGKVSKGKIARLSTSSLHLLINGVERELSEAAVLEIKHRQKDSLLNGTITGGLVGLIAAALASVGCHSQCGHEDSIILLIPIGVGIGAGIDGLIAREQTIYHASGQRPLTRLQLAPMVSRNRKGLVVRLSF